MKSWASMGCAANKPPSTGRITPDIPRDSSLAKKTAAIATSQGVPSVPRGTTCFLRSRCSYFKYSVYAAWM